MSPLQRDVYIQVLKSKTFKRAADVEHLPSHHNEALALTCILTLKKISNHPALIYSHCCEALESGEANEFSAAFPSFPADYGRSGECSEADSGKMAVLMDLLAAVKAEKGKVVVVSNYVETLNIIQALCTRRSYSTLRLDGSTPTDKRQALVDQFNSSYGNHFIFLLTAKTGGQGLNFIGGNRLILFDPDWNPATDLQAMARIWRDGQPLPCFIYRLISTASIDEKIIQRQMRKQEVAGTVMREKGKKGGVGGEDGDQHHRRVFDSRTLKELFKFQGTSDCETFEVLKGKGKTGGGKENVTALPVTAEQLKSEVQVSGKRWECVWNCGMSDDVVVRQVTEGLVSSVWSRLSTDEDKEEVERVIQLTEKGEGMDEEGKEEKVKGEEKEDAEDAEVETQPQDQDEQADCEEEEAGEVGEDEEVTTTGTSDPIEEDDPIVDWKKDVAEAKFARQVDQRKRKQAEALRLAQEDARLVQEAEEEVSGGPQRQRLTRRRMRVEEDEEEEEEFMKGVALKEGSPPPVEVKGEEEREEETMAAIQALVNAPGSTNVSAAVVGAVPASMALDFEDYEL